MKVAVVSDIHGNLQAYESVLAAIDASECAEMWCLGDVVGYGGDPEACVELTQRHAAICLAGNHDLGVIGALDLSAFSRGANLAAMWTRETLTDEAKAFLGSLKPSHLDEAVGLFHASPRDPVWEYVLSTLQAELCLDGQRHQICLIGHSHVALSFARQPGSPATGATREDGAELDLSTGEWLINPGSVGQPRDSDPRAAWLELDLDGWWARYHRVAYDIEGAAAAIRRARLPDSLAERLSFGQ